MKKATEEEKLQAGRLARAKFGLAIAQDLLQQEMDKKEPLLAEREALTDAGDIDAFDAKLSAAEHNIDIYTEEVENAKADVESKKSV